MIPLLNRDKKSIHIDVKNNTNEQADHIKAQLCAQRELLAHLSRVEVTPESDRLAARPVVHAQEKRFSLHSGLPPQQYTSVRSQRSLGPDYSQPRAQVDLRPKPALSVA